MTLPLWFLILSLFLPRITLIIAYLTGDLPTLVLTGWISPTIGLLIPRALMLILIFQDQGMSAWLLLHAIVMAAVYIAGGSES